MLFTPFPLLRGDVYKGLGAFVVVVVLLLGFFGFCPLKKPPRSLLLFLALLGKQNRTKIKIKNQTPHTNNN